MNVDQAALSADTLRAVELAAAPVPALAELLERCFPLLPASVLATDPPRRGRPNDLMTPASDRLAAVAGGQTLFAVASPSPVSVRIDDASPAVMSRVPGSPYWVHLEALAAGVTHSYEYEVDGLGLGRGDVAGYTPMSCDIGSPAGQLIGPIEVTSAAFGGAVTRVWLYVCAGVDPSQPSPFMVWLDGQEFLGALDLLGARLLWCTDNVVAAGKMPPLVHVLVAPGVGGPETPRTFDGQSHEEALRSLQFDVAEALYGEHIVTEVLPAVASFVTLSDDRADGAAGGMSSGGAGAFGLGWFHPGRFSRVYSTIGSFVRLRPGGELSAGGDEYARLVGAEARDLRVWLSTGVGDINVGAWGRKDLYAAGSWLDGNRSLAQSLERSGYDHRFVVGTAGHNLAQAGVELPDALAWLWSDHARGGAGSAQVTD